MFAQLFAEMLQVVGGLIFFYFIYIYYKKHNDKPASDTPSMAQTALRELVERAVDEARKLPGLGESESTAHNNINIEEQSYEDLLATAILNKVIEKYQKEHVDGNSNMLNKKSSEKYKLVRDDSEDDVNDDVDGISIESSISNDECSKNKMRKRHLRQDSLSLTIEEQIEEITTLYTSDDDPECLKTNTLNFQCSRRVPFPEFGMDIVDPSQETSDESHDEDDGSVHVDHITPVESWEENWLFQKKKISIQSDPITMLVPNPNADYRALIGDKDADDTSDLSEFSAQSDDDAEEEVIEAINSILPKSSTMDADISTKVEVNNDVVIQNDEKYNKIDDEMSMSLYVENTEEKSNHTVAIKYIESTSNTSINEHSTNSTFTNEKNNTENYDNKLHSKMNQFELLNSNLLQHHDIPPTPTSSPIRNSFCENESSSTAPCDFEKLNEKLEFIEKNDEELIESVRECREAVTNPKTNVTSQFLVHEKHENNLQLSSPPRPGTIAEREHKKWENAPPIENNPYSQENIQKRLLERQYSRRASDINGNSAMLPTTPSPSLQIVIGANRPDIKRFSRDYYINESKSPTGERLQQSGTSSRPSSSLSHHSNSTGSDFEQQVSHGLDTFEESSLRGSLCRRTFSRANVTSHFATNPLIHMDITDENTHKLHDNIRDNWKCHESPEMQSIEIHEDDLDDAKNWNNFSENNVNNFNENSLYYFEKSFLHSTINPLYNEENKLPKKSIESTIVDRDSGTYSIDSYELEFSKTNNHKNKDTKSEKNNLLKLSYDNNNLDKIDESQIYIANGKKYWTLNSQKFHTFGGIKRRRMKYHDNDMNNDNNDLSDNSLMNTDTDFPKFKFQTFGGIKYRNEFDRMGIAAHRSNRARPSIKLFTESSKRSMQSNHRYSSNVSELPLKRAILDDRDNLKLEPPLVPVIIEKEYTSLSDMRKQRHDSAKRYPITGK